MISVVTPSFGQLDWLRLAVASVADQEGVEVEHIVQDGGTEGIEAFGSELQQAHAKLFVEKDVGMYDAINRGLKHATGQLCAYLNCDEQYLPGTLRQIADFFVSHPEVDVVFGDVLVVDERGNPKTYRRAILPSAEHIRRSHLNVFSCATFFRHSILEKGHWLDAKWRSIGDAVWIYEMLKAGRTLAVYPQLLSVFALTGRNLSIENRTSEVEKSAWLAEVGRSSSVRFSYQVGLHRLRKLLAGAYLRRSFSYEIYTLESPRKRVRFSAINLGGFWKGSPTLALKRSKKE